MALLLQSIVIHPVKRMAVYFTGFLYLVTSFILVEKWSLHCSWTSRLLSYLLCANQSLLFPNFILSGLTLISGKYLSTGSHSSSCLERCSLPLLCPDFSRKGVDKGLSLLLHILSWTSCWKCLKSSSWQHLTPRFILSSDRTGVVESSSNQSWWELDLLWASSISNPR